MKLLYYSPASYGGIADYAHHQANALVDLGVDVTLLSTPKYPTDRGEKYKIVPILQEITPNQVISNKFFKKIHFAVIILLNFSKLVQFIKENHFQYVLFGSYVEYLAPIWSGSLRQLAKKGVVFGAVIHDPVRDFVVGPQWWHNWSVACGYSFVREAFVHETIQLDTVQTMPQLNTTVIPFGIYRFAKAEKTREEMRVELNLPLNARVLLAFGHIRDNKNLDLVIRAMVNFPDLYLIVAGKEQSLEQRPAEFYQNLAIALGVAARCQWQIKFLAEIELANLFAAADLTVLTYSQTFHSGSSTLNTAANYYKPCLASSGQGCLCSVVQKYDLGIWVEPDNIDAIIDGIGRWFKYPPNPQWEKYLEENSWELNAKLTINALINQ